MTLSPEALSLFLEYAEDAGNWSGTPPVNGNIIGSYKSNGYLTAMKKQGLIDTSESDGVVFINFTKEGVALAAEHGVEV